MQRVSATTGQGAQQGWADWVIISRMHIRQEDPALHMPLAQCHPSTWPGCQSPDMDAVCLTLAGW